MNYQHTQENCSVSDRERYLSEAQARLKQLCSRLNQLQEENLQILVFARENYKKQLNQVDLKNGKAEAQLNVLMENSTVDNWQEIKDNFESDYQVAKNALERATAFLFSMYFNSR